MNDLNEIDCRRFQDVPVNVRCSNKFMLIFLNIFFISKPLNFLHTQFNQINPPRKYSYIFIYFAIKKGKNCNKNSFIL